MHQGRVVEQYAKETNQRYTLVVLDLEICAQELPQGHVCGHCAAKAWCSMNSSLPGSSRGAIAMHAG